MSFILDALKKSEMERQRQSVPGLMDTRVMPRRSRLPVWGVALGLLLAVNLGVLTFVLMRKSAPDAHESRAVAAPPVAAASAAQHFSPLDPAPQYAPEIPVAPADSAAPEDAAVPHAAPAPRPVHRTDPLLSDEDANADNQEVLPTINEITLTGAQTLPELHLDVHVYATKSADRFVYINMRKYHEGGRLQEGPAVERIRRDGVVLNYQGLRFLLPRQP
jgi:general secretion pathway protein B